MKRVDDQQPATPERRQFDAAFIRAIDRQAEMVAHTPGWKPLIDLVWEELQGGARSESAATKNDIRCPNCGWVCEEADREES